MQKNAERHRLYAQGMTDAQIAAKLEVSRSAIYQWRRSAGLPPRMSTFKSWEKSSKRPPMLVRKFLHELGWGSTAIARQEGVSTPAIREWRQTAQLPCQNTITGLSRAGRQKQLRELQRRVIRAIGTRLPFDIAADAAASLMLAIIEGEVPINEIEKHARRFGNQALNQYANSFRQRSLDEDTPGSERLRHIDILVDESSSGWLEEMGATVH